MEKADKAEATGPGKCHLAMTYFELGEVQRGLRTMQAAKRMDPKAPEIQAAQELAQSAETAQGNGCSPDHSPFGNVPKELP